MWLLIPILVYCVIFLYVRHVYSYWRRKGFPHEKANITWTYLKKVFNREFHYVQAISDAYESGKERFVENHGGNFNDSRWDYVRSYRKFNLLEKLSPVFSAARLEVMFRNIEKVGDNMLNHLNAMISLGDLNDSDGIDMQHLLRIYSVNIIANLIYGLEIDVFKQTDSIFQQYLNNSIRQSAVINSYTLNHFPKKNSLTYRLRDLIRENVERREEGGVIRKDILQILVKFRNGNDIEHKQKLNWHIENLFEREKILSIKKLAHITEYLLENGMSSMASTAVFTLYEILQQGELKEKIAQELSTHKWDNEQQQQQVSYESLKQLKLMDLCIQETVRKYPSVPLIQRVCRKAFSIPDSKRILSEGKSFIIPLLAIQRDAKYFEDPLSYKPQRFVHDSNGNQGESFIGFGLGAKTCIAQNFVKLVVKFILVKLFLNYNMDLVPTEDFDICYNNTPCIQSKEGFKVKLKSKIKFDI